MLSCPSRLNIEGTTTNTTIMTILNLQQGLRAGQRGQVTARLENNLGS